MIRRGDSAEPRAQESCPKSPPRLESRIALSDRSSQFKPVFTYRLGFQNGSERRNYPVKAALAEALHRINILSFYWFTGDG